MIEVIPVDGWGDQVFDVLHEALVKGVPELARLVSHVLVAIGVHALVGGDVVLDAPGQVVEQKHLPEEVEYVEHEKEDHHGLGGEVPGNRLVEREDVWGVRKGTKGQKQETREEDVIGDDQEKATEEGELIVDANAVVDPSAVMIKSCHAVVTATAMLGTNRTTNHASETETGQGFVLL